ncbi:MAG: hypothetical protein KKD18_00140 [Nanoarchaeota archaeon]|nr:hypothetical protein [Nanoarchaeota archaeon]MBU0976807.1 hypothetical protein [Nanoarchaeota archaeon]
MAISFSLGYFYGTDSALDFLIALVAFLIAYQSSRVYKLINEKNYRFFSWAFLSVGLAFLSKIIANLTILNEVKFEHANFIISITHELQEMQLINFFGATFYKIFLLIGFLILFLITTKTNKKEDIILFSYFAIIAVLFSIYFNFVFHLTLIIILTALTIYFYNNYKKTKSGNSYKVYLAFLFILISHAVDLFYGLHVFVYLLGEVLVFTGFVILLINHTKIKNGEKKNQVRGNQRPPRSSKER